MVIEIESIKVNVFNDEENLLESAANEYEQFNKNGDGEFDREKLKAALEGEGITVDVDALNAFFVQIDADGDGKISKLDYLNFFAK